MFPVIELNQVFDYSRLPKIIISALITLIHQFLLPDVWSIRCQEARCYKRTDGFAYFYALSRVVLCCVVLCCVVLCCAVLCCVVCVESRNGPILSKKKYLMQKRCVGSKRNPKCNKHRRPIHTRTKTETRKINLHPALRRSLYISETWNSCKWYLKIQLPPNRKHICLYYTHQSGL
jgi:hypothetical protein